MIYAYPYIFIFLIIFSLSFIEQDNSKTLKKDAKIIARFSLALILFLFLGLRGLIGMDWVFYKDNYDRIPRYFSISEFKQIRHTLSYEGGWNYFTIICRYIGLDYISFQTVNWIIDFIFLYLIAKRYQQKNILLFFTIFLVLQGYTFSLIILRNSKVIYLFILSLRYIKEKKFLKYELLCIIGFFFHKSVIICMPLYFILGRQYNKKFILALFIVGLGIFILQISYLKMLIMASIQILPETPITRMVSAYMHSDHFGGSFGLTIGALERIATFIIFYRFQDLLIGENNENIVEWNCYLIFIFLNLYFNELYIVIERLPNYFIFTYWIFYPKLFRKMDKPTKLFAYICLIVYGTLRVYITVDDRYYKYENVLTGISTPKERVKNYGY